MKETLADLDSSDDDMDSVLGAFESKSNIPCKDNDSSKPDKTDCNESSDGYVMFIKVVLNVTSTRHK